MALTKCPECEKSISDKAESCPHCGLPLSPRKDRKKSKMFGCGTFILIAFLLIFISNQCDKIKTQKYKSPSQTLQKQKILSHDVYISAKMLYSDYKANEVAADQKYKGRLIKVFGEIDNIGKDILGDPYVAIKTDSFACVQCMFDKSDEVKLASLSKGQSVNIVGRCSGKTINIILRDCVLR